MNGRGVWLSAQVALPEGMNLGDDVTLEATGAMLLVLPDFDKDLHLVSKGRWGLSDLMNARRFLIEFLTKKITEAIPGEHIDALLNSDGELARILENHACEVAFSQVGTGTYRTVEKIKP